jgi:hypothetical protein
MESSSASTAARSISGKMILRILAKAMLLLAAFNLLFVFVRPMPWIGRVSAYNVIFPGRERLPYGDEPQRSFNLSITLLDAMFASHRIDSDPKPADEYRVILIGDSATWGFLLTPEQTLAEQLNALSLRSGDGRMVRAYNLGYPTMSLTKDLLFLEQSMRYEPDLIVWLFTLESVPWKKQLDSPILTLNPGITADLIERNQLPIPTEGLQAQEGGLWQETIFGQRRELADWVRLQLFGLLWAATSVDQDIPETYNLRMEDLPADISFQGFNPGELGEQNLAFEVLSSGFEAAGGTPVLLVNEPMFISQGSNSELRYNFYYPRWAYDEYREWLAQRAQNQGWQLVDLWNFLPSNDFTDSAIHYSPEGSRLLAVELGAYISGR